MPSSVASSSSSSGSERCYSPPSSPFLPPLSVPPIKAKRVLYIMPHAGSDKVVHVLDLTVELLPLYDGLSDEFRAQARKLADETNERVIAGMRKTRAGTSSALSAAEAASAASATLAPTAAAAATTADVPKPLYTLTKENWNGTRYNVRCGGADGPALLEWRAPFWFASKTSLVFPAGSAHSTHDIEMAPVKFPSRREMFVKDGAPYQFEMDSRLWANRFTLYKVAGARRREVACFAQGKVDWWTGGPVVVDTDELDEVVAVVTCAVMLKKKRQREGQIGKKQRRSGSG